MINKNFFAPALAVLAIIGFSACANSTSENVSPEWDHSINFDWKFAKGDQQEAVDPGFDDASWEEVDLPHDWAISGPFGPLKSNGNTGKLPWKGKDGTGSVLICLQMRRGKGCNSFLTA